MFFIPGDIVNNRWTIKKEISRGGQGVSYKAVDLNLQDSPVFMKFAYPFYWGDIRRFSNEVHITMKLYDCGLSVPRVSDIAITDDSRQIPFYHAAWIDGISLDAAMLSEEELNLDSDKVIHIADQVATTLIEAHRNGIIHADIKPSNLLVEKDRNTVKLVDWGIAVLTDSQFDALITKHGTGPYEAPEQRFEGIYNTPLQDQYSFGMLLHTLLSREAPPEEGYWNAAYTRIKGQKVPSNYEALLDETREGSRVLALYRDMLSKPLAHMPEAIREILLKALHPDPVQRFHKTEFSLAQDRTNLVSTQIKVLSRDQHGVESFWQQLKAELKKEGTPELHTEAGAAASNDHAEPNKEKRSNAPQPGVSRHSTRKKWILASAILLVIFATLGGFIGYQYKLQKDYPLVVKRNPKNAKVEIIDHPVDYFDGISLKPGDYTIKISAANYRTEKHAIVVGRKDNIVKIDLEKKRFPVIRKPGEADKPDSSLLKPREEAQEAETASPPLRQNVNEESTKEVIPESPEPETGRQEAQTAPIVEPEMKPVSVAPPNMVRIPAGEFLMGNDHGLSDEKPAHEVYLDEFYIDIHEVTVNDYRKCLNAGKCSLPDTIERFNRDKSGREDHPVNGVNWNDARSYCRFMNKRLPTEAEWEKAATWKGNEKYTYPSGSSISCSNAVMFNGAGGCGKKTTWPVGSRKPEINGTFDMAGNVREWVQDGYKSYSAAYQTNPEISSSGGKRGIRGGDYRGDAGNLRGTKRDYGEESFRDETIGFRCALSP